MIPLVQFQILQLARGRKRIGIIITVKLTKDQVNAALLSKAKDIICTEGKYLKNGKIEIGSDGSALVHAELEVSHGIWGDK